jgi:hypothetical protein
VSTLRRITPSGGGREPSRRSHHRVVGYGGGSNPSWWSVISTSHRSGGCTRAAYSKESVLADVLDLAGAGPVNARQGGDRSRTLVENYPRHNQPPTCEFTRHLSAAFALGHRRGE